jgi:hypothetical protein
MQGKRTIFIAPLLLLAAFALYNMPPAVTHAQTAATGAGASGPTFLMTWQAVNSYAPAGYAGEILPNQQSEIMASVEVISPSGQPVDLSGQTIYWYQNENLLGGSIGTQRIEFRPYGEAPNVITLRVDLPDYPGGDIEHEINIPIVQPVAVIEAPFPDGDFSASPITLQALPYFFDTTSTDELSFSWSANGQTATNAENPTSLQISLPASTPAGYELPVTLTIQSADGLDTATGNVNLTYQHQL